VSKYPVIRLKHGKDEAIRRFHPWVFSGAIAQLPAGISAGTLVQVVSQQGNVLGTGYFEEGNIAIKLLSFEAETVDTAFWQRRIGQAFALRRQLGLTNNASTNTYRLIHSEGDGLPGLIVDVYNKTAVIQAHSAGILQQAEHISEVLQELYGNKLEAVYNKSAEIQARSGNEQVSDGYLRGGMGDNIILENNQQFKVDWETGQKTGFFIDQRVNRQLLSELSAGKRVLNTFSYSGGFSVAALKGGALQVVSVDSSKKAINLCDENILLNGFDQSMHTSVQMDAKRYLSQLNGNEFDIIVLDPPAFAKNHHNRHKGLEGYKYINFLALKNIAPGGLLFTFSCSQAVDRMAFQGAVMAAAIETGRTCRILYHLSQPADHPVNIYHPEGAYLKGLVLAID